MNLKHQFDAELEQAKQRCIMVQGNLNEVQFQMQQISNPTPANPDETPPELPLPGEVQPSEECPGGNECIQ